MQMTKGGFHVMNKTWTHLGGLMDADLVTLTSQVTEKVDFVVCKEQQ